MPTSAELERIEALIGRLLPLSTKRRGELIEAEEWNLLVGALLEIGRAALEVGADEVVPDHAHPDQVGIGWLDPRLRELLTGGGPLNDTAVSLVNLRRDLTGVVSRLDLADSAVADVRSKVNLVSTQVLQRESDLDRLDRKVIGAAESRADVADLRLDLDSIRSQVDVAVKVSSQLEVGGAPLDVQALLGRVRTLEQLRDSLTRADGALLDAAEFDRQVADLKTSLVTQDVLTSSLAALRDDVLDRTGGGAGGIDRDQLLADARAAAAETSAASVDSLGSQLRAELAGRLDGIEPLVSREVERATQGLADSILADAQETLGVRFEEQARELGARVDSTLDQRLGELKETVGSELEAVRERIGAQVGEMMRSELDAQLGRALEGISGRLQNVEQSVDELRRRGITDEIARDALATQLAQVVREQEASRSSLRDELLGRMTALSDGLPVIVTAAVDDAQAATRSELNARVDAMRRDLQGELAQVARDQATTEVQVLSTTIRSDLQGVIRQEVDASMATLRDQVRTDVGALQTRVAGLVADEVTRQTAGIPERVRAEFDAFRPELDRTIDASIRTRLDRPPIR
jgi:hypothetical protein